MPSTSRKIWEGRCCHASARFEQPLCGGLKRHRKFTLPFGRLNTSSATTGSWSTEAEALTWTWAELSATSLSHTLQIAGRPAVENKIVSTNKLETRKTDNRLTRSPFDAGLNSLIPETAHWDASGTPKMCSNLLLLWVLLCRRFTHLLHLPQLWHPRPLVALQPSMRPED